ncbi:MAG TPA: hypothetical protein VFO55_00970 [Gemmatimonadaceae bacterium]|nr:hypothetical protein [Gemmatimonadaceae bacterium]
MRARITLVMLALSLPVAEMAAQRVTVPPRTTRAPRPAEKPPQAPGIPDARLYSRYRMSRFSFEQYPMLTQLRTTGFIGEGIAQSWMMLGDGSHLGFRVAPSLSVTADMTSAFAGGPISLGSADLGLRAKPWVSRRIRPFADARLSWAYTTGITGMPAVLPTILLTRSVLGDLTTGSGRGALLGVGAETSLRTRLILSAGLSATRYSMRGRRLGGDWREWDYTADAVRLSVGLRYNPGRWMDAPH